MVPSMVEFQNFCAIYILDFLLLSRAISSLNPDMYVDYNNSLPQLSLAIPWNLEYLLRSERLAQAKCKRMALDSVLT